MKIALLVSEILRGTWAIEPRLALSYGPLISDILSGKSLSEDIIREPLAICAVSGEGERYNIFDEAPKGSTAIIPLKGVMRKYDGLCSHGTETIAEVIRDAANSKNIDSIILDIDSGGGSVDAVPPLIDSIRYAQKSGTPVVAHADLAASAAYWAASECDLIIADNDISSEFGSIGVMVQFADLKGYYEKEGQKIHTVYAPESTHKNLPVENALADVADYTLLKEEVLSPIAKNFQNNVRTNRPKLKVSTEGILAGKMFYAADAVENGLADKIGNMDFALKQARRLATGYQFAK